MEESDGALAPVSLGGVHRGHFRPTLKAGGKYGLALWAAMASLPALAQGDSPLGTAVTVPARGDTQAPPPNGKPPLPRGTIGVLKRKAPVKFAPASGLPAASRTPLPEIAGATGASQLETAKLLALTKTYGEKGWNIPFPSFADSVIGDAGGIRSRLAEYGLGFYAISLNTALQVNMLANGPRTGPQVYGGQIPTAFSTNSFGLVYDLGRIGDPGAQLIIGGYGGLTTWDPDGPTHAGFTRLAIYQPFFDDDLSVKIGIFPNDIEFFGIATGGSLVGGTLGPGATIPFEVGMSRIGLSTPAVNIRGRFGENSDFYDKLGIQRSVNPQGPDAEVRSNPYGVNFGTPGAGVLIINEFGYKRESTPQSGSLWARVGGMYNDSDYFNYKSPQTTTSNGAVYAAVDYQFSQLAGGLPFQGYYFGATYVTAPPEPNLLQSSYEARIYGIGILPTRPFDFTSLIVTRSDLSSDARRFLFRATGSPTFNSTTSFTLSHSYHASKGIYISPSISYTIHPSATSRAKDALSFGLNFNFVL